MKKLVLFIALALVAFGAFAENPANSGLAIYGSVPTMPDVRFYGAASGVRYEACCLEFVEYTTDSSSREITFYINREFSKADIERLYNNVDVVLVEHNYIVYRYSTVEIHDCAHELPGYLEY